eukprot:4163770-Alexandrium_andersonii.AAC.1
MVERIASRLDACRAEYVKKEEQKIIYGGDESWVDVEADEGVFRKGLDPNPTNARKPMRWEQRGGV